MQSVTRRHADSNRTPPTLRRWAREKCRGVHAFRRFHDDSETFRRGWTLKVQSHSEEPPEGFEIVTSKLKEMNGLEYLYVQIREERDWRI